MQTLTFWWIDDEVENRVSSSVKRHIEDPRNSALKELGIGASLIKQPIPIGGDWTNIEKIFSRLKAADRPDLLIIDQRLGNISRAQRKQRLGTSLAVILRSMSAGIPIVLISAAGATSVLSEQRKEVIDFFDLESIKSGERIPDLYAIAIGFRRLIDAVIKPPPEKQLRVLFDLLSVPDVDRETFRHCIPPEFIHKWDEQTSHAFARWTWNDLLGRPGFLYDDLSIATMLGVDISVLPLLEKKLSSCIYKGAFVSPIRRQWWVSLVRDQVMSLTKGTIGQPLWELGRSLIPKEHLVVSRAFGHTSSDSVPNCVAYRDGLQRQRVAARLEDTVTLPYELPAPGFEPVRIFHRKSK